MDAAERRTCAKVCRRWPGIDRPVRTHAREAVGFGHERPYVLPFLCIESMPIECDGSLNPSGTEMEVGEGIFLGAVVIGLVFLYNGTKDRWKWKKIVIWSIALTAGTFCLLIGGVVGIDWYKARPYPASELFGVSLGASRADVRFVKGEPRAERNNVWAYDVTDSLGSGYYIVGFKGDAVRYVFYAGDTAHSPRIAGLTAHDSLDEFVDHLGDADEVAKSKDNLRRIYSFKAYQVFAEFQKNKPSTLGIYDPAHGAISFVDEGLEDSDAKSEK